MPVTMLKATGNYLPLRWRESDLVSCYTYIPVCVNPAAAIDKKHCQHLDSNGHVSECDRCVDFFFLSGVQTLCIDLCLRLYIV